MKNYTALSLALLMGMSLTSCGLFITQADKERNAVYQEEIKRLPVECDLSHSEANQVIKVTMEGDYKRDYTYIENIDNINVLHSGVVGRFGCPVQVHSQDIGDSDILFWYNPENMKNVPEENLILLHYNEETDFYDTMDFTLDANRHIIQGKITEPGVYMLADAFEWYGAWGEDVSAYAHDTIYQNTEFCFEVSIPKEVQIRYISSYLQNNDNGRYKPLMECEADSLMQSGIDYLEYSYYDSPQEFVDENTRELEKYGIIQEQGVLPSETRGYYFYTKFDENYIVNCFFPLSATQYIKIWYGFKDEQYFEKVLNSLKSFDFYGTPDLPDTDTEYDFSYSKDITGKDISIELPDEMKLEVMEQKFSEELHNGRVTKISTPLLRLDNDTRPEYVLNTAVFLEESQLNPRREAKNQLLEDTGKADASIKEMEEVSIGDNQKGYLFCIHDESGTEEGSYWMYGFYNIPDSHQYVKVMIGLRDTVSEAVYQRYWNCLKTVNTADSDKAIGSENLVIEFPENFYAEPVDRNWGREFDNEGNDWYRAWLLQTDHEKCRQAKNTDYSGAFFYLIDTGRTASEDIQKVEENHLTHDSHYVDKKEEITLSDGQKGYLLCLREEPSGDEIDYRVCYMYGYYEIPDTNQYVEVEFMLNEPMSEEIYQAYWNCLKSVDIDLKD